VGRVPCAERSALDRAPHARVPALEPHFAEGGKPIPGYKPVVPAMPVDEA